MKMLTNNYTEKNLQLLMNHYQMKHHQLLVTYVVINLYY